MGGYNPSNNKCAMETNPHQGGYDGSSIESEGEPNKVVDSGGGYMEGGASDDGQDNTAPLASFAASHGMPAVQAYPEGVTPMVDTSNVNGAGEASSAIAEYPHRGAPARTTQVGGGTGAAGPDYSA